MDRSKLITVNGVIILALLSLVGLSYVLISQKPAEQGPSAVPAEAFPAFTMTDQNSKQVTNGDLRGKVWVANFIFTRCSGVCPVMTGKMYQLQEALKDVSLVSFSVDPEYDRPDKLKAYAGIALADESRWHFLTGDMEMLNRVTVGLHFGKFDEPMMHTPYFVLVDRDGTVRGYYDSDDASRVERLKADAASLTRAAANG